MTVQHSLISSVIFADLFDCTTAGHDISFHVYQPCSKHIQVLSLQRDRFHFLEQWVTLSRAVLLNFSLMAVLKNAADRSLEVSESMFLLLFNDKTYVQAYLQQLTVPSLRRKAIAGKVLFVETTSTLTVPHASKPFNEIFEQYLLSSQYPEILNLVGVEKVIAIVQTQSLFSHKLSSLLIFMGEWIESRLTSNWLGLVVDGIIYVSAKLIRRCTVQTLLEFIINVAAQWIKDGDSAN